jgi:hypothetical protein
MWKQCTKLYDRSTANMDAEELASYQEALRLIETDLHFATRNVADDEWNLYVLYFKLLYIVF